MNKEEFLKEMEKQYDEERETLLRSILRDIQKSVPTKAGDRKKKLNLERYFHKKEVIYFDVYHEVDKEDAHCDSYVIEGYRPGWNCSKPKETIKVHCYTNIHFAHVPPYSFKFTIENNSDIDDLEFCQALHRYFCDKQMPELMPLIQIKTRRPQYVGCLYSSSSSGPFLITERSYASMEEAYEAARKLYEKLENMNLIEKGELSKWSLCTKEVIDVPKNEIFSARSFQ